LHDITSGGFREEREVESESVTPSGSSVVSVTFNSFTFSDGRTVKIEPTDIVVLVGPNNAGKSVALKELRGAAASGKISGGEVITKVDLIKHGTLDDLRKFLRHLSTTKTVDRIEVNGISFTDDDLKRQWEKGKIENLGSIFISVSLAENRITYSDQQRSLDY